LTSRVIGMRRGAKSLFNVVALVCLASLGCGGSSTDAHMTTQCDLFTPCGGSIVGAWRVTGTCSSIPDAGTTNADAGTAFCLGEHPYSRRFRFTSDNTP
jgi:hypothetical protein